MRPDSNSPQSPNKDNQNNVIESNTDRLNTASQNDAFTNVAQPSPSETQSNLLNKQDSINKVEPNFQSGSTSSYIKNDIHNISTDRAPSKIKSKTIAYIIIAVLLVTALLVAAYFLFIKNHDLSKNQTTTSVINKQTESNILLTEYSNAKLGFIIKYPKNWYVKEDYSIGEWVMFKPEEFNQTKLDISGTSISVHRKYDSSVISDEDFTENLKNKLSSSWSKTAIITLAGHSAVEAESVNDLAGTRMKIKMITLSASGYIYTIDISAEEQVFDQLPTEQIFNSFKLNI